MLRLERVARLRFGEGSAPNNRAVETDSNATWVDPSPPLQEHRRADCLLDKARAPVRVSNSSCRQQKKIKLLGEGQRIFKTAVQAA